MRFMPFISCFLVLILVLITKITGTDYLYIALLFLPFTDTHWKSPGLTIKTKQDFIYILACLFCITAILILQPQQLTYFMSMLLLTALPEEWFFRAYLLNRTGTTGWRSNLTTSLIFTTLHLVSNLNLYALLVIFPSMIFGWVYQKTANIYLVIFLHALSNLFFVIYIK